MAELVTSYGGRVEGWPNDVNRDEWEKLTQRGIDAARRLGVEPVIPAKEMSDPDVDHLGVMAYAAWFEHLHNTKRTPARSPSPAG